MKLAEILNLKYPKELSEGNIIIQDDGQGAYIKYWNIEGVSKPNQSKLDEWQLEVQSQYELEEVLRKRVQEYPTKEELIIALWEAQVEDRPQSMQELQAKRQVIKSKYPKPE